MTKSVERERAALEQVIGRVQPRVRAEHPYVVAGDPDLPVKLNQNESPYDLPEALKEELLESIRALPLNRYPREHPDRLAKAIAESLGRETEEILVGNGSNEISYLLGLCLIEAGTPVVLPRPMFSLYEKVARLFGADLASVPALEDLSFDVDSVIDQVTRRRPALTILATPNNPTGLALPLEEIRRVAEAATGVLLVDEAYAEFNEERSALELTSEYPHVVVMRTFSKAWGLAGLRVGYLVGHPQLLAEFRKARLPFVVDRIAEAAAVLLLKHADDLQERIASITVERKKLEARLGELEEVQTVPSQANFVIFRTSVEPSLLMARLAEAGVLLRDMGGYPELRGYLRVNAGTPDENRAFLAALEESLLSN